MVPPFTTGLEALASGTGFPMRRRRPRIMGIMILTMLITTIITVTDGITLLTVTMVMEAILRM